MDPFAAWQHNRVWTVAAARYQYLPWTHREAKCPLFCCRVRLFEYNDHIDHRIRTLVCCSTLSTSWVTIHTITSFRQPAAAPPLGRSKYELNDHLSRLSDLGTHVVLRANTASQDLRCIDRVSTNDLWACMFVVRSCHFHSYFE